LVPRGVERLVDTVVPSAAAFTVHGARISTLDEFERR
jgi:hypothetical protein